MALPLPPRRFHFGLAALAWTAFAVYGSLVPLRYRHVEFADALERFRHLPPLWVGIGTRADWVANILLFIPLTFLWMAALTCDRGKGARAVAALILIPVGTVAAIALEFTQIWFPRTVSINDIVAETLGGAIGVILWLAIGPRTTAWLRAFSGDRRPRSQITWLLEAYCAGLFIYSVVPLDLTISVTELYHKYQRGAVLLIPFSYLYESPSTAVYQFFADIVEFIPVGAWVALTQRHRLPDRSPVLAAIIGGGITALVIEFVQLLVQSRFTDVTDVLLGTLGAGIGGWLVGHIMRQATTSPTDRGNARRESVWPWLTAIAFYSMFLAAGFWFPFDITHDRAIVLSRWNSFFGEFLVSLYLGNEFNAITQLLIRVLLFAPLGILWGRVATQARGEFARRFLVAAGFVYSALLALGIELVQILMPPKIADATDALLCTAGAALGLFVSRRLLSASASSESRGFGPTDPSGIP